MRAHSDLKFTQSLAVVCGAAIFFFANFLPSHASARRFRAARGLGHRVFAQSESVACAKSRVRPMRSGYFPRVRVCVFRSQRPRCPIAQFRGLSPLVRATGAPIPARGLSMRSRKEAIATRSAATHLATRARWFSFFASPHLRGEPHLRGLAFGVERALCPGCLGDELREFAFALGSCAVSLSSSVAARAWRLALSRHFADPAEDPPGGFANRQGAITRLNLREVFVERFDRACHLCFAR